MSTNRRRIRKTGGSILPLVGVAILIIGAVVGYKYYSYHPKTTAVTCSKDFAQKSGEIVCTLANGETVNPDLVFSQDRLIELVNGGQLDVTFEAKNAPTNVTPAPVNLQKESSANFNQPLRRKLVDEKRAEFTLAIARLKDPQATDYLMEIYVDVTSGIKKAIRDRVLTQSKRRLESLLATSNVTAQLFYITRVDNLRDNGQIVISKGGSSKVLTDFLTEKLTDSGEENGSAVATGLFNAMKQNSGKERIILLFTDLMENDSRTANFYSSMAVIKDKSKWPDIKAKLTSLESLPDLKGAKITVIAPPNVKSAEFRTVLPLWTELLTDAQAVSVDSVI